ncbi:hypothetical protein LPJ66_002465 [Kickxella alabastrina]|uniref:Uncharacterized protein n=1 Tax=Kickxella alabastrina TaxID=61397 RepID=A0ACC1IQC5_9FUNG|nr:hypothetical protein LPJ66_002465 [Kickxella alabastrina]
MLSSKAGGDPPLDLAGRPGAAGNEDAESLSASGEAELIYNAASATSTTITDPGNNTSGGNNTRSFRFLLTLALRKAQTAVTLDNGGHVEESIRTYREAISMLGLVLDRTSEEDGRQRLLHFRQTYSDRVSVLASLRPQATESLAATNQTPQEQIQSQTLQQETLPQYEQRHLPPQYEQQHELAVPEVNALANGRANFSIGAADGNPEMALQEATYTSPELIQVSLGPATTTNSLFTEAASRPNQGDSAALPPLVPPKSDADMTQFQPLSPIHFSRRRQDLLPNEADSVVEDHVAEMPNTNNALPTLKAKASQLKLSPRSVAPLSPIILNKPLPPLAGEGTSPVPMRKDSVSSLTSAYTEELLSPKVMDEISIVAKRNVSDSPSIVQDPVHLDQAAKLAPEAGEAEDLSMAKQKLSDKEPEKGGRRQSIKSQRSLPAMFGIGLKGKAEKLAPPVPQLPAGESSSSNIGRRLFGALRNNSISAPVSDIADFIEIAPASEQLAENLARNARAVSDATIDNTRAIGSPVATSSTDDIVIIDRSPITPQADIAVGPPPPTPMKDIPQLPSKSSAQIHSQGQANSLVSATLSTSPSFAATTIVAASELEVVTEPATSTLAVTLQPQAQTSLQTMAQTQRRQSKATNRLVGLFKRNPSIPDIMPPIITQKPVGDAARSGLAITPAPPAASNLKDRRLSTSASTPNLIEVAAAAAAANNDQPAMAVYAATERGDIPPMPVPPTMRPSISLVSNYNGLSMESIGTADDNRSGSLLLARTARGGSISDTMVASMGGILTGIEDQRSTQQQQVLRPTLRIATQATSEALAFVSEHTQLHDSIMSASADGTMRSRKSSVAASGSQSIIRNGMGLAAGIVSNNVGLSSNGQSSQQSYGRPTLADVEEDQRLEMFDLSFGTFQPALGPAPPKSSPLSALWFINTLHRSMTTGGAYLTPSLFIPRRLWFQTGIRVAAIETKLGVLAQLTQSFSSMNSQLSLPNIDALFLSNVPAKLEECRAETTPWESEDKSGRNNPEKDSLHKACVALHHWLNNLEEMLESNRRLLAKKLKFVNPSSNTVVAGATLSNPLAAASNENLQASFTHLPFAATAFPAASSHDGNNQVSNASFPNLTLSNGDLANGSSHTTPMSPTSPVVEPLSETRTSDVRIPEAPNGVMFGGSGMASASNANRDQLSKDQMGNSRFKGLGKLGKSVDRLYSNIQKEKLDDTSAYVVALQRLFEAAMVLEGLMHYFSRVASDTEMSGWFTDVPQSPVSLANRRPQHRTHGESVSRGGVSPLIMQAALTSEPSVSSIGSAAERKSSNASTSTSATAAAAVMATATSTATTAVSAAANGTNATTTAAGTDKKNRRRSNYFSQRQNSTGFVETNEAMPSIKHEPKPRTESFSSIPRLMPTMAGAAGSAGGGPSASTGAGASANGRFILAQSPIKNPMSYVQQGRGRAPGVIYARLVKVAEWLNQVLLAWIVRDLQVLYAKYIKRLREWVIE